MKYHVYKHDRDFGILEAATTQAARDLAAQQSGYTDEADMKMQEGYAELVAVRASWE